MKFYVLGDNEFLTDDAGNVVSLKRRAIPLPLAKKELATLKKNCRDCWDCLRCSRCSDCSDCSDCSYCSGCSHIAYLEDRENLCADPTVAAAHGGPPSVPVIPNIHQTVFAAASRPEALNMNTWHSCANTHCWAGWVVTLAGEAGKQLETFFDTPLAAMKILDASSDLRVSPVRFFETNDDALRHMKALADQEAGA